jgi:acylphosphatase
MDDLASVRAIVSGRVQGVFFRAFVCEKAEQLGLTGYVRNLHSGIRVEVFAEGSKKQLEALIGHLKMGPPAARVREVTAQWSEYSGNYKSFSVKH